MTNGMCDLAQWMCEDNKAEIDALPNFVLNTDKANELLDLTEWKFEADGKTPFDKSRLARTPATIATMLPVERLVIRHLGTEDNNVTDNIEIQLLANTYAGIDWSVTRCDFAQLLDHYYDGYMMEDERLYTPSTWQLASPLPLTPTTAFTAICWIGMATTPSGLVLPKWTK